MPIRALRPPPGASPYQRLGNQAKFPERTPFQPAAKLRKRDARIITFRVRAQVVKVGRVRVVVLTLLAMVAFASNSLLCRLALRETTIDATSFTSIRLLSGATTLWLIVITRKTARINAGSWTSALALFAYAAAFSFAYTSLSAGTGALLLFGAVQATSDLLGITKGRTIKRTTMVWPGDPRWAGWLHWFFLELSAPPIAWRLSMISAGIAWGNLFAPRQRRRRSYQCYGLRIRAVPRFRRGIKYGAAAHGQC